MYDTPLIVEGSPADLRERLSKRVLVVRTTWFPTPRELRAWNSSGVPAYARWLRGGRIEIGPRLESMWAACFTPVLRGRMEALDGKTRVVWRRSWPRFTIGLIGMWATVLAAWMMGILFQLSQGHVDTGALFWWTFLAVATFSGPWLGARYGGPELEEAERWVRSNASGTIEEDW